MEVRIGPPWLRWSCDGWLAFLGIMILALYKHSRLQSFLAQRPPMRL
jgi:hypothetical protein